MPETDPHTLWPSSIWQPTCNQCLQFVKLLHDPFVPPTLDFNLIAAADELFGRRLGLVTPSLIRLAIRQSLFCLALDATFLPMIKAPVKPPVEPLVELFSERRELAECTLLLGDD